MHVRFYATYNRASLNLALKTPAGGWLFSACYLLLKNISIFTLSIASHNPSANGLAFMYKRLCLLGDFDKHVMDEASLTVSR